MNRRIKRELEKADHKIGDIAVKATASLVGNFANSISQFNLPGPEGMVLGGALQAIVEDLGMRLLSPTETERMSRTMDLAAKVFDENAKKSPLRKDFDKQEYKKLFEGSLIKARESYEEKKIPLFANLLGRAPFTNSHFDNLIQTLIFAEQLSYRQLCIIGVIGELGYSNSPTLSDQSFKDKYRNLQRNEEIEGVYFDIHYLISSGIMIQLESDDKHITNSLVVANIVPSRLRLYYPGTMLFNGLLLSTIDRKDLDHIISLLR